MAMTAIQLAGTVVRQEWSQKGAEPQAVLITVKLTALAGDEAGFDAAVAARAFLGDDVIVVQATAAEVPDDLQALIDA
jgi:hypothetical protein